MGTNRKNLKKESLKIRLTRLAHDVIEVNGVELLSIRDLTSRLDVTHGAAYKHFKSKEHLLAVVAEYGFQDLTCRMRECKEHIRVNPKKCLEALQKTYLEFAVENKKTLRLMFGSQFEDEVLSLCEFTNLAAECFDLLVEILQVCQDLKVVKSGNAREQAFSFWSSLHGHSTLYIDGKTEYILGDNNNFKNVLRLIIHHNFNSILTEK
jgi:AcrR family transcriptional regulator